MESKSTKTTVTLRLAAEDYNTICAKAAQVGMSPRVYITAQALERDLVVVDWQVVDQQVEVITAACDDIHTIATSPSPHRWLYDHELDHLQMTGDRIAMGLQCILDTLRNQLRSTKPRRRRRKEG